MKCAVQALADELPQRHMSVSSLYETQPVDCTIGGPFLNAVVRFQTPLSPRDLLRSLQSIERRLGRTRPFRNAPRTIDLDILLFADRVIREDGLEIPHPRLHHRLFALVPLAEVGFPHHHARLHRTVDELRRRAVRAYGDRDVMKLSQESWPAGLPR